jgi:hypothetical protein
LEKDETHEQEKEKKDGRGGVVWAIAKKREKGRKLVKSGGYALIIPFTFSSNINNTKYVSYRFVQ